MGEKNELLRQLAWVRVPALPLPDYVAFSVVSFFFKDTGCMVHPGDCREGPAG